MAPRIAITAAGPRGKYQAEIPVQYDDIPRGTGSREISSFGSAT
jgi:hypothetical protein